SCFSPGRALEQLRGLFYFWISIPRVTVARCIADQPNRRIRFRAERQQKGFRTFWSQAPETYYATCARFSTNVLSIDPAIVAQRERVVVVMVGHEAQLAWWFITPYFVSLDITKI